MALLSRSYRAARAGLLFVLVASLLPAQHTSYAKLSAAPFSRNANQLAPGSLIINEVSAANIIGLADEDGDTEDWVELLNTGATTLNLGGVGLSDKASSPFKWTFTNTTTLAPGAYLLVFASKKDRRVITSGNPAARLHTNFTVRNGDDSVTLTAPDGTTLDTVAPKLTKPDMSYGRSPNAGANIAIFVQPTPGAANITLSYPEILPAPAFSTAGGFYSSAQSIALTTTVTDGVIRYTLDGSAPTENSPVYAAPLNIASRLSDPNVYSIIPSIPITDFLPPEGNVYKSTVLRAAVFKTGAISSTIGTNTYFVDPNISTKYAGIPIVSLAVDPEGFWGNTEGIYVPGPNANPAKPYRGANFWDRTDERPVHIEYFTVGRTLGFANDAGTEIHGNISRQFAGHALSLKMRDAYGTNEISYPLFADKTNTTYKRLVLWNGGQDYPLAYMRDSFAQGLMKGSKLDYSAGQPAIIFINGEYWGMLHIRESIDPHFVETYYGVDTVDQDFLETPSTSLASVVRAGNTDHYVNMSNFVSTHPMTDSANFETLKTMMDVDNYAFYLATEFYVVNHDWPYNNVKLWRPRTPTGIWRWMLQDLDFSFNLNDFDFGHNYNMLDYYFNASETRFTLLGKRLQYNPIWRNTFLNTAADQMNYYFLPQRMTARFTAMTNLMSPFMAEHRLRWPPGNPFTPYPWASRLPLIQEFINKRTPIHRQHITNYFGLTGSYTLTAQLNISNSGYIKLNTLDLGSELSGSVTTWQGVYFNNVPISITAVPRPGYRFIGWSGASTSLSSTISLTPTSNTTLTALFDLSAVPPPTYNLASGPYQFTQWFSNTAAGTYPPNMQFQQVINSATDPGLGVDMDSTWTLPYSITSKSRINGEGTAGVSFVNTSNQNTGGGYLGAATLWVNTSGQSNVCITWTGGTLVPNTIVYAIRLQYRVGSSGTFVDVLDSSNNPVIYMRNATASHAQVLGPVGLPAVALNQTNVELRWRFYYAGGSVSGSRAQLRLDDITVQGSPTTCSLPTPTPTPTSTATSTSTPTATSTNTPVPTATSTNTPAPTATSTNTPVPTVTATDMPAPTATSTDTPVPTATSTNTPAPTATSTDTPIPTATSTDTPAATATATNTPTPTATSTDTPVATATATNTPTPTATSTNTPVATATATNTPTPTATSTNTPAPTATATNTPTPTSTPAPGGILDAFNRANGPIGSNWIGSASSFTVTSNKLQSRVAGAEIYWNQTFGPVQRVEMQFGSALGGTTSADLILKATGGTSANGAIQVSYTNNNGIIVVYVFRTGFWSPFGSIGPTSFAQGDVFGAMVNASGLVTATKNGLVIGTVQITQQPGVFDLSRSGQIGFSTKSTTRQFDNFDGGTVGAAVTATATKTPVATVTATNTPVATATATNTPVATATATNTPVATATATNTPAATATATNTPVATSTATATNTPAATATAANTPVATATRTPTPTATSVPGAVLDNFNRPGPALGPSWVGSGLTIVGNQLKGGPDEYMYWQQSFGTDQWARIKVVQVPGCGYLDVLLKATGGNYANGLVDVSYNPCASPKMTIYAFNPTINNWAPFASSNTTLTAGDVFTVRAQPNRLVTVYKNGIAVMSGTLQPANAGFDVGRAGQIGLAISGINIIVDDFDGGDFTSSTVP